MKQKVFLRNEKEADEGRGAPSKKLAGTTKNNVPAGVGSNFESAFPCIWAKGNRVGA